VTVEDLVSEALPIFQALRVPLGEHLAVVIADVGNNLRETSVLEAHGAGHDARPQLELAAVGCDPADRVPHRSDLSRLLIHGGQK